MFDADDIRTTHARELTASLTKAGHKPPKAVTAAVAAYDLADAARASIPSPQAHVATAASILVLRAEAGKLQPDDLTDLTGGIASGVALAASQEYIRSAHRQALKVLGYRLSCTVGRWLPDIITGKLRSDYLAAATVIDAHAPSLPLTLTDSTALRGNDAARRSAWTDCLDAADVMGNCLQIIEEARQMALYPHSQRDPIGAFSGVANPYALDDYRLLTGNGFGTIRSTLPEHPLHRLLEMSRRGAIWHLPTTTEQDAAAAAWFDAETATKARLSGRAA